MKINTKINTRMTTALLAIILVFQILMPTGFQIQAYAEEQLMGELARVL